MTIPDVSRGRGAFSPVGKDNGQRNYAYVAGKPADGSDGDKDANYQAVHLGVKAIQARVNDYKYSPALVEDGVYGESTKAGVKWVQAKLGFSAAGQDGIAGPNTCRALWRDLLIWFGGVYHVPASHLYGFMMLESLGDPGALGVLTPADRGLNQISEKWHPSITDDQAFDPVFSIDYTAERLGDARAQFSGKSVALKNYCSIAQHNNPLKAQQWYKAEMPPDQQIQDYVNRVLQHASNFK